ncbi:MAG TPA: hypothetical protein PK185_17360 [Cyclobacteriaceae bacterium]|nr:hypothetical protein [Cyclobacteriaceae bacterium]
MKFNWVLVTFILIAEIMVFTIVTGFSLVGYLPIYLAGTIAAICIIVLILAYILMLKSKNNNIVARILLLLIIGIIVFVETTILIDLINGTFDCSTCP